MKIAITLIDCLANTTQKIRPLGTSNIQYCRGID
jgi:hypothetical protein